MNNGPMDKAKGGKDWGWEMEVGGVGESGGGKMETTVPNKIIGIRRKKQERKIEIVSQWEKVEI